MGSESQGWEWVFQIDLGTESSRVMDVQEYAELGSFPGVEVEIEVS